MCIVAHMVKNPTDTTPPALSGQRAVVTGGTRGIGAAIAQRLLADGASVVMTARSLPSDAPEGASFVEGDLGTPEGVAQLASRATAALGGIDILVNNAGAAVAHPEGMLSISDEEFVESIQVNFLASVRLTAALLDAFPQEGQGRSSTSHRSVPTPRRPRSHTTPRLRRRFAPTPRLWRLSSRRAAFASTR
jgi:NAD(P)-dependent dehydrogenase (short-subunit alcohol dehydrogenase family)